MSSATPTEQIAFLRSRPLASLVEQEIERQILSGELAAGVRLNELEIARRLGISRAPVRESLRTLEQAGLVVSRKNFGVFVRTVSIEEVSEIYQVRSYMDAAVGAELARGIGARDLKQLEQMEARMRAACEAGDPGAYHELNVAFHERMVELVGNAKLVEIYRQLLRELALYRCHSLGQPGAMERSIEEHGAILAAIRAGDAAAAGQLMGAHILASSERLQQAQKHVAPATPRVRGRGRAS